MLFPSRLDSPLFKERCLNLPGIEKGTGNTKKISFIQQYLQARYIIPLVVVLFLVGYLYSRSHHAVSTFTYSYTTMDTVVEIRFQAAGSRKAEKTKNEVFAEIERLEKLLSRSVAGSDVYRINKKAGIEPVAVNPETFYVAEQAISFAALSGGAFDPTIAPVTDLWGFFSGQDYRVPGEDEIEIALSYVDYEMVELDPRAGTVYLPHENMGLELGGIAKGYIVDRALDIFIKKGIEHAYVNAGDIGLLGTRPDGLPWRIGIRHPRDKSQIIAVLSLADRGIDTSGDYERAFEKDGIKYHHILDPATGMPASGLASVTVVAETTLEADVLSTAAFVLGTDRGLALVESIPGVEAVFCTPELEITVSSGLEEMIEMNEMQNH